MPSPFPGMDPYLEGWLWADLHHRLANEIASALSEQLSDAYVVLIDTNVRDMNASAEELQIMFPDLRVEYQSSTPREPQGNVAVLPPRVSVPALQVVPVRTVTLKVQTPDGILVTAIEILSPANKDAVGVAQLQQKWQTLRNAGVHLIEIDLLRRGRRMHTYGELSTAQYLLTVTRRNSSQTDAWPFSMRESIPAVPVPLLGDDEDAVLEIQPLLQRIYQLGRYGNLLKYDSPPPPPALSDEDARWMDELLSSYRKG